MRKAITSALVSLGLVLSLLTTTSPAQANVPPSNCVNSQIGLVSAVICEIDIDDNDVIEGLKDIKIIIVDCLITANELEVLVQALDDLVLIPPFDTADVAAIQHIVEEHTTCRNPVVVILPCGCSQSPAAQFGQSASVLTTVRR